MKKSLFFGLPICALLVFMALNALIYTVPMAKDYSVAATMKEEVIENGEERRAMVAAVYDYRDMENVASDFGADVVITKKNPSDSIEYGWITIPEGARVGEWISVLHSDAHKNFAVNPDSLEIPHKYVSQQDWNKIFAAFALVVIYALLEISLILYRKLNNKAPWGQWDPCKVGRHAGVVTILTAFSVVILIRSAVPIFEYMSASKRIDAVQSANQMVISKVNCDCVFEGIHEGKYQSVYTVKGKKYERIFAVQGTLIKTGLNPGIPLVYNADNPTRAYSLSSSKQTDPPYNFGILLVAFPVTTLLVGLHISNSRNQRKNSKNTVDEELATFDGWYEELEDLKEKGQSPRPQSLPAKIVPKSAEPTSKPVQLPPIKWE